MNDVFARGEALREFRLSKKLSQFKVEHEAGIGTGSLSKIELGERKNPSYDMMHKIVTTMAYDYVEYKDMMEKFRHAVSVSLPSSSKMKAAGEMVQPTLNERIVPAYLIDCSTRLITWNMPLASTFGLLGGPKSIMGRMRNKPIFEAYFDPQLKLHQYFNNPHEFLSQSIASLRQVLWPYRDTDWYQTLIDENKNRFPEFRAYWNAAQYAESLDVNIRSTIQLQFSILLKGELNFIFVSDPFPRDPRFRIIQWIPYDAHTWTIINELNSNISRQSGQ